MPVFIPVTKKGNAKEYSNYHAIVFISYTSKVMLKFLKLGFSSMWTENFQKYFKKVDFKKAEEPEIIEKAREFQKQSKTKHHIYFCFID